MFLKIRKAQFLLNLYSFGKCLVRPSILKCQLCFPDKTKAKLWNY